MMPFDPLRLAAEGVRNLGCYHGAALLLHMCRKPLLQELLRLSQDTFSVCHGLGCAAPYSFSSHRLRVQASKKA